jgi:hypothetical protein
MASSKRTGLESGVERYTPIRPESLGKAIQGASRRFLIGKRRYFLDMTIPLRDPIGVLWLDEPSKTVGKRQIRGVLSPARFTLSSASSEIGGEIGPETEISFTLGRPIDLFQMYGGEAPESVNFDRWDFLSIEFTARHRLEDGTDEQGRPNSRLVVKGIRDTRLDLGRFRAEAMALAGVDGEEVVTKTSKGLKVVRRPIAYRALSVGERNRLQQYERAFVTDEERAKVVEIFLREGGLEAQGKRGQMAPIKATIAHEIGRTEEMVDLLIHQARKQGDLPAYKKPKKKGKT